MANYKDEIDKIKLQPCPFCGSKPIVHHVIFPTEDGYDEGVQIECYDDELATGLMTTLQAAADAWNNEVIPACERIDKTEHSLQPCPFCGSDGYMKAQIRHNYISYGVKCDGCWSEQLKIFATPEEAAAAWNNRNSSPLTDLAEDIHENAKAHGWWDESRSFGDIIALCHSELSEALEEYRNGKQDIYYGEDGKPEGVAVEMIDCIIRILDWCSHEDIDIDEILKIKHEYNKTRPYRHGGKKV